jgi:hypothetical protein
MQVPRITLEHSQRKGVSDGALQGMFKRILGMLFHMCGRVQLIPMASDTLKNEMQELIDGMVVHFAVLMIR